MTNPFRYIVVEGPIGVGKTSLASKLAGEFGSDLMLEKPTENPFLEKFYRNPSQYALSAQLYFLMQRAQQVQDFVASGRTAVFFPPAVPTDTEYLGFGWTDWEENPAGLSVARWRTEADLLSEDQP